MIKVIARQGLRVPTEEDARRYITDSDGVEVDDASAYYIRRLRDGDLLMFTAHVDAPDKPAVAPGPDNKVTS
jgi:hypothetical protein